MDTKRRKVIDGFPISGGLVLGKTRVILPGDKDIVEVAIPAYRCQAEIDALDDAVQRTISDLRKMYDSAGEKSGTPVAKIFEAQLLIASDYEFLKQVKDQILARRRNAGYIYNRLVRSHTDQLKRSHDRYMRQMAEDIEAVAGRVLSKLTGHEDIERKLPANTIVVGRTFAPGDVVSYRQRRAAGFLIAQGGGDSHMALISRSFMLPVVSVKEEWKTIPDESRIIVDGTTGKVIVNPNDDDWALYQKKKRKLGPNVVTRLKKLVQFPPLSADGKPINLAANISIPGPMDDALAERNIPIGLFRTEFIYLSEGRFPDEDTQYDYYWSIAQKFAKSTVVLRTFDIGYDKISEDTDWPEENNPALGWRGIRAMLEMGPVFKTQLKAILRASKLGNIKIMLPMISELAELEKARRYIAQAKLSLRRKGIPFDEKIEVGIMVEVPSAALIADALAPKVDFMSIGTNDLTQYTMAADRMNRKVGDLYSPYHPAVLQLIHNTVQACRKSGKPISICGEVAGDTLALPLFVGMGVSSLSMTPSRLLDLCRATKRVDTTIVKHLVAPIMSSATLQSVIHKLESYKVEIEKKNPKYKGLPL